MAVLVPYGESRAAARALSASLFARGVQGAWAFPWVLPLALLRRPLGREELKILAGRLREASLDGGGRIQSGEGAALPFPESAPAPFRALSVYGPVMDLPLSPGLFGGMDGILHVFSRAVLGCAIAAAAPDAGKISFRAAAAANMLYRREDPAGPGKDTAGLFFTWKLGKPVWLPPVKKHR
ncbi:MAG: hypothetical protein LBK08_08180 [Treponema sp.]|jgi:hypothetical protein|nr:hypothetical protein [Treponema sp.]